MAATIKIKNSSTASAVPTSSDLVQGELAVNVTDKRIFTENASGTVVELGTNPTSITLPDGSASAPTLTNDGDTNTGLFFPAADTVGVTTGGTERVRVDSSGNVGIGVSPTTLTAAANSLQVYGGASQGRIAVQNSTTGSTATSGFHLCAIGSRAVLDQRSANSLEFTTDATERMRIDSSGNLLVGTTSNSINPTGNGFVFLPSYSGLYSILTVAHASGVGTGAGFHNFTYNSGSIGAIVQNGTTAVSYNTTSDYRLKENVQPLSGALAKVAALRPCTYTWKLAPDEIGEGFIAHELAEVCPQAVTGEKDAVDEEGNPKYQSIDTSFLVATLTAAIQELKAVVDAQAARIEALEAA